jgi:hypothetical protein
MTNKTVSFDKPTLRKFKKVYNQALGDAFVFEGNLYVKGYAKYLIEYLEMKFKGEKK